MGAKSVTQNMGVKDKEAASLAQEVALRYHIPKPVSWAIQEQVLGLPERQLCNPSSID